MDKRIWRSVCRPISRENKDWRSSRRRAVRDKDLIGSGRFFKTLLDSARPIQLNGACCHPSFGRAPCCFQLFQHGPACTLRFDYHAMQIDMGVIKTAVIGCTICRTERAAAVDAGKRGKAGLGSWNTSSLRLTNFAFGKPAENAQP